MKTGVLVCSMMSLLALAGCALNGYQGVKTADYPASRQAFDVTFGWKKNVGDNDMTVTGYARNNRYFIIKGLELRVSLVAATGTEKTAETFFFIPRELREGDVAPFSVFLKLHPQTGDKLRFLYRYAAVEDSESAQTWMSSFEVNALD